MIINYQQIFKISMLWMIVFDFHIYLGNHAINLDKFLSWIKAVANHLSILIKPTITRFYASCFIKRTVARKG